MKPRAWIGILLESPNHKGVLTLTHDLNQLYHEHPELWEADSDASGFSWIEVDNAAENIIAFRRIAPSDGKEIIFVGTFHPSCAKVTGSVCRAKEPTNRF
jgi:1,4-alpha-glucan branching enzyme